MIYFLQQKLQVIKQPKNNLINQSESQKNNQESKTEFYQVYEESTIMMKQISFSVENDHFNNQNIFTFDEDEQDLQVDTNMKPLSRKAQLVSRNQQKEPQAQIEIASYQVSPSKQKPNQQLKQQNGNLFVFDNDQDQQIDDIEEDNRFDLSHKSHFQRQSSQYARIGARFDDDSAQSENPSGSEEFNYLKNKILFKQQSNNFVTNKKNECKSQHPSSVASKHNSERQPVVTKSFENKVKKVRQSIKENNHTKETPAIKKNGLQNAHNPSFSGSQNSSSHKKEDINNFHNLAHTSSNFKKQKPALQQEQNQFEAFNEVKSYHHNNSQRFAQQQFESKSKYEIKGAKIIKGQQLANNQFQYVEQQKAIKVTNLKQFLFTQLSDEYKVNALITRVQDGSFLGKLVNKTKYFVTIEENNKFLFSITKDGFNKFIFSMNKDDCTQKNKNYLGQMISKDFSNSEFILYDSGFDPKQTKCLQYSFKQLASIKYQDTSGPRKFSVILSTNNKGFHSMESQLNILEKKWSQKKDRRNLCKLYSKEPKFDSTDGTYKLDFKAMIGKPSVKNFVLSSDDFEDCLLFARRNQTTYAVEVKHPFSLVQAVAICMSSIHHKSVF